VKVVMVCGSSQWWSCSCFQRGADANCCSWCMWVSHCGNGYVKVGELRRVDGGRAKAAGGAGGRGEN